MFIFPLISAIKKRAVMSMLFLIIVGFNLLFESMLERQAGVVFYAFFNSLLYLHYLNENLKDGNIKVKKN
jgi:hypothetical protein